MCQIRLNSAEAMASQLKDKNGNFHGKTGLTGWLGSRDSNPDSMIQSHVSYHWTTSQRRRHDNQFENEFQHRKIEK